MRLDKLKLKLNTTTDHDIRWTAEHDNWNKMDCRIEERRVFDMLDDPAS